MNFILILGLVAAALTSLAGLPQLIKSLKTKNTSDLSLGTFITLTIGVALWIIYGIAIKDIPLIGANIVTLAIIIPILLLKLKYK